MITRSKLLAVACASLIAVTAWSGSQQEEQGGPVTIRVVDFITGGDGDIYDAMLKKAIAELPPTIKIESKRAKWEGYYEVLAASISGGDPPDVAIMHLYKIVAFVAQKALVELDDLLPVMELSENDFAPLPFTSAQVDGNQYGIPLDLGRFPIFYNPRLLRQAGLLGNSNEYESPVGRAAWLADFRTIAEKTGKIPFVFDGFATNGFIHFLSTLSQNGGQLLTIDNKRAAFNTKEGVEALQFWCDLVNKYEYTPPGLNYATVGQLFRNEEAVIECHGCWHLDPNLKAVPDLEVDRYPSLFNVKPNTSWVNTHTYVIPRNEKRRPDTEKAGAMFVGAMIRNSAIWAGSGAIPCTVSFLTSEEIETMKHQKKLAEWAMAEGVYDPMIVQAEEVQVNLSEQLEAAIQGKKTAEQALKDAEDRVNAILSR